MNYAYPVAITKQESGGFVAIVPDFDNEATTAQQTVADAMAAAGKIMLTHLFQSLQDGEPFPTPTDTRKVKRRNKGAMVTLVQVDLGQYAREHGSKVVNKTLTVPAWLDHACAEAGFNYSKILKSALIDRLERLRLD